MMCCDKSHNKDKDCHNACDSSVKSSLDADPFFERPEAGVSRFCLIYGIAFCALSTAEVMLEWSIILAKLFHGKPPKGILPVLTAHFFYSI